ncbi:MAG: xanthine dehydrogenase family protein subunit M [Chloroflexi bacterium]|nr:xanthine dehydrogenase family protein subunit M [Chloroflexota bacterium]
MQPFELHQPDTLDEVLSLLEQEPDDTHLIAGGTSLMLLMQLGLVEPKRVVALRKVPGLDGIERTPDGGLRIGTMATHRQAETSEAVRAHCGALRKTFADVATVRIRNQGTVGGNIAHADPAQDPPPMLIALGAEAVLRSKNGERSVPLDEFFLGYLTSVMQPGEVLMEIRVPPLPPGSRARYEKFLPRTQDDYATVSVAATLRTNGDGKCEDVRVALGSVGGTPIHARPVEDALRGETLTDSRIADAAALVLDLVDPPDDARGSADYKRRMARVWTERALKRLRDNGAMA